ncbi:hypothetical protein C0Q70_17424 [Pomacea canaliculata]|uniref:Peptidase S54 rhomboid domain-containing protein n=1 Tax=Pomacea canaliculata TaxID=400727 RepID=A0A2T7NKD5_POMCA|nr:rhomboid-related protein 2-like [Pomacea canaliculata]PVD21625.1 hypothetical protein C0Q70_17424 [Pomacea canaliculata]
MLGRWQYGHLESRASSATAGRSTVFSVEEDLTELERQLHQNLELHFRPIFQRFVYGGERIASHDLRRLLQDETYRDLLPPDKVYDLIDLVDFNPGKAISYMEFVKIVTGGLETYSSDGELGGRPHGVERKKTWMNSVCRNTMPQAEVDDYLATYRWIPPPFFMITISLAQLAVFLYYVADIYHLGGRVHLLDGVAAYSPLMYLQNKRQEVWRFVSYIFLHQGWVDLILNLGLQVLLGFPLEVMFRWWRMAIVYVIGIITGSLLQSVSDHSVGLAGAAGGTYAIVTGHVIGILMNWSELNGKDDSEKKTTKWFAKPWFRLLLIFIVAAVQISLAIYRRFCPTYPTYKVGIGAHAGGILAGLLLGRAFLTDSRRYPWSTNSGWLDMFVLMIFFGCCVLFNILYKSYPEASYY